MPKSPGMRCCCAAAFPNRADAVTTRHDRTIVPTRTVLRAVVWTPTLLIRSQPGFTPYLRQRSAVHDHLETGSVGEVGAERGQLDRDPPRARGEGYRVGLIVEHVPGHATHPTAVQIAPVDDRDQRRPASGAAGAGDVVGLVADGDL